MESESVDTFQSLHEAYSKATHPDVPKIRLEDHIDRKASDVLFLSLQEAEARHRMYHSLIKSTHPMIMVYGDTLRRRFPLVLFLGREPNDRKLVGNWVGRYNFDGSAKKRRCGFWNMAYKLVGESLELKLGSRAFKDESKSLRSSVIALADISPRSIPYRKRGKRNVRKEIRPDEFDYHFKDILGSALMRRVAWVVLSGSETDGLQSDRDHFEKIMVESQFRVSDDSDRKWIRLPFLSGNTYPEARKIADADHTFIEAIRNVVTRWHEEVSPTRTLGRI